MKIKTLTIITMITFFAGCSANSNNVSVKGAPWCNQLTVTDHNSNENKIITKRFRMACTNRLVRKRERAEIIADASLWGLFDMDGDSPKLRTWHYTGRDGKAHVGSSDTSMKKMFNAMLNLAEKPNNPG